MEGKILKHIKKIFKEVRNYLLKEGWKVRNEFQRNPEKTGDISGKFDLGAEDIVIQYCQKNNLKVKLYTEEKGEIKLVEKPEWTFFVDPVDGSVNFWRGIEGTAFSIAVAPGKVKIEKGLKPGEIQYALVGSVVSGSFCFAEKGKGAFYKGIFSDFQEIKIFSSKNRELKNSLIEIDLDFATVSPLGEIDAKESQKIARILPLIYPERKIRFIRRNGSAALGLMELAMGAVDAYIDVRDRLTPENWLAAYLLIREAGGVFTDLEGEEVGEIKSFREPGSFLGSGNRELHQKILDCLKEKEVI